MRDDTSKPKDSASLLPTTTLEELVRRGARQLIQRAVEVEVEALLSES
ncbi:IS256 family transposase, partial [Thiorhodococcus mannitoliphagus]|nr:IS256 family transposase [Thiorhodococcus mannitoliphagus]